MSFQLNILPGDHVVAVSEDQTLLDAAAAAGLLLPHSCRDGVCGACKGKVLEGTVDYGQHGPQTLTDEEKAAGLALFCCATARSDLTIECRTVNRANDIPVRKLPCRVQEMTLAAPDVMVLKVKLPATEAFAFRAGQYIDFLLPGGKRRSFSIANPPSNADHLELHIRHVPDGAFTGQVFSTMKVRDILRFEGPLGSFFLREDSAKPIVLLAGGTGFAPIKGLIEHAIAIGLTRPMTLYWGARDRAGLYLHDMAAAWADAHSWFKFVPVLSDNIPSEPWTGRTGLVHQAVMADLPDLSGHQVYACGAPVMIDAAHQDFTQQCGLPDEEFFADAFTYALESQA
ncbi:MAG TPA: CDP-6-deoxy-delta-3,4-glucoseen reductase [Denitromonas sp.]|nr:CDP-6-deoxy-delta-3,4-glucoseen reductase [Rhodocyclaceae bacterium]MCP5221289.1 CDP-6-deoxy-delta-3,4-glucoseen reductase [Zoogloeaceae bacterium]HQU89374.1 CDP-6-deoxy-delta-3,4-glucoseen reductase [Denitromonas sp.]HQV14424.1 CDP-6-deoxy-delta-3,4-glucoseen reductase [Denitromonas sp.]